MAEQLDELAALIAEKALARLRGDGAPRPGSATHTPDYARIGREQPATPPEQPKQCTEGGCNPCEELHSCSARELYNVGTARLTPLAIRTSKDLAPYIDHTLLKPDATVADVIKLCDEARKYGFATVCLNSSNIALAARQLAGSSVKPIAVVGFPL